MGISKTLKIFALAVLLSFVVGPVADYGVWGVGLARANDAPSKAAAGSGKAVAKLQTSEAVREAMEAIRYAVVINHSLVTHRRMPVANALQFEADLKAQTARIRGLKGLSENVVAAIAPILKDLDAGAAAIGKSVTTLSPMDGLLKIDEALSDYESTFDHPGWKGIQEL